MTETSSPQAVRREVAFSEAIFDAWKNLEEVSGVTDNDAIEAAGGIPAKKAHCSLWAIRELHEGDPELSEKISVRVYPEVEKSMMSTIQAKEGNRMRKVWIVPLVLLGLIATGFCEDSCAQEIKKEDCFFLSSLHYTAKGMEYWYDKANGGLEIISGVPYSRLTCQNCHVPSSDRCHKIEKDKKAVYSTQAAKNQAMCLECHAREQAIIGIGRAAKQEDVHYAKGMECMDCHSASEMHGDGIGYFSMKQPGAMDTKCEKCHPSVKPTDSHTVHGDKVDCKACHVRQVVSCTNCHFETQIREGKRVAIPVSGWVFLMNFRGKVSTANMQTFVVKGEKTLFMFAPQMSHSIMKEGRKCDGCHGTKIMKDAQIGKVKLTWLEEGKVMNLKGVIPVVKGVDYQCVYQDRKEGKWVPIENPSPPIYHYAAFGEPLSKEQLGKLIQLNK